MDLATARDIAFHFNPRFNERGKKVIIRNSCIGEKWGKEERELQHFPFVPGQNFEVRQLQKNPQFDFCEAEMTLTTVSHVSLPDQDPVHQHGVKGSCQQLSLAGLQASYHQPERHQETQHLLRPHAVQGQLGDVAVRQAADPAEISQEEIISECLKVIISRCFDSSTCFCSGV